MPRLSRQRHSIDSIVATVSGLADTGEGSAVLPDGSRRLVAGALAGEVVRVAPLDTRRARLLAVVTPSSERVAPACPYLGTCGGCDLMHLELGAQQRFHAQRLALALGRACGMDAPAPVEVFAPSAALGYRSRARLALRGDGVRLAVGFRAARSHAGVRIEHCAVLEPALDAAFAELPALFAGARGDGEASLAKGAGGARVYDIRFRGELLPESYARCDAAVRAGTLAGVRVWLAGAREPATFGDARPRMLGADGAELVLAAGSFAQPSDAGARALAARVGARAAELAPGGAALELFAGSGTLSVALARARTGALLEVVESDPEAIACLRENLAARGLVAHVRVRAGDANAWPVGRDVALVVLDPPRAGARAAVANIARSRARHVLYVSCAPSTLARDAGELVRAGFTLRELVSLELFPQTQHAEALAWFARGG